MYILVENLKGNYKYQKENNTTAFPLQNVQTRIFRDMYELLCYCKEYLHQPINNETFCSTQDAELTLAKILAKANWVLFSSTA
jgi:hypothetical protein